MFLTGQASPHQPQRMTHDAGALFRKDDARELLYFGSVGQMMADFIPQNAFRASVGGKENVTSVQWSKK